MFVFHGILGIVNADIDDEITLNTIKLFVKNRISVKLSGDGVYGFFTHPDGTTLDVERLVLLYIFLQQD